MTVIAPVPFISWCDGGHYILIEGNLHIMAMIRKASNIRKKLHMLVYGEQGTGKSRTAMQLCYLKNAEGRPFRVLYIDTENGSIDNYTEELAANGANPDNLLVVYTQSLAEVQDYIKIVTNNDDFEDDDGNVILDGDGEPFRADALVIDSASILKMSAQQGLTIFSQKRAKVKATAQGLTGDEKAVKIEGAGMELKDFNTLNFKGQSLILDLNASGVNYVVVCREKDEKRTKVVNGSIASEATGRKIPDGFTGQEYNVDTEFRLYFQDGQQLAYFDKDRTGVHKGGEIVEDLTLLQYQDIITGSANNKEFVIKNGLNDAVKTEVKLNMRDLGIDSDEVDADTSTKAPDSAEPTAESIKAKLNDMLNSASPIKKNNAAKALKEAGLPTAFRPLTDIEKLKKIAAVMEKELA